DPKAKKDPSPVTSVVLLVLKGQVDRSCPECQHALAAPPGPALFQWDSVHGQDRGPQRLEKLPAWAGAPDQGTPLARMKLAKLDKFRKAALADSIDAAIKQFVHSEEPYERRLGLYAAAGLDRLEFVAEVLNKSDHADTWRNAAVALRHWLG